MKIGIIGLPNAGKTTIFNALCGAHGKVENYPFTTIEPNVGSVHVPDQRLQDIAAVYKPQRVVSTTIDFQDIAGLVKGASQGEGLGNQFLSNIRPVEAIVQVVRFFHHEDVVHTYGGLDPRRDIEIVNTELILSDLEIVEKNIKVKEKAKLNDKFLQEAYESLLVMRDYLQQGKMLKDVSLKEEQRVLAREYGLLTFKSMLYAANVDENVMNQPAAELEKLQGLVTEKELIFICGEWEAELKGLDDETRKEFMADAGVRELGLDKLVKTSYTLMGLVTFFSTESAEVRAWTVAAGTKAPQAAGKIHTDMEQGFIKAEVVPYHSLMKWKDPHKVKEHGELKIEGREYVVQDGDVIKFHFKV